MNSKERIFVTTLIDWSYSIHRPMPWKGIQNPYYIWLSEIIMQQTRVEQGLSYYHKFTTIFPTIHDLAAAPLDIILKNWEGLGYYSRARNMHETAKKIVENYQGVFPITYDEILSLKGVGPYTAAAISSFAYNLPNAVVDGNVVRVLSRFFGLHEAFDSPEGKKKIQQLAQKILPVEYSAIYNQAIMDFGALVCKPALALCDTCVLQDACYAYKKDLVKILPIKTQKTKVLIKYFNYLVFTYKNFTYIKKREKDFWKDLFEFYLIEGDELMNETDLVKFLRKNNEDFDSKISFVDLSQKLSHRNIQGRFFKIKLNKKPNLIDFVEISNSKLSKFAFPKIINLYIDNNF